MKMGEVSRREFLKRLGGAAAAVAGLDAMARAGFGATKSRVVVVYHSKVLVEGHIADRAILDHMLDEGIKKLTGRPTAHQAWKSIAGPQDVVSAKWNQAGGLTIETHPEIRDWVRGKVLGLGVPEANCVVWSRKELSGQDLEWSEPYTLPSGMTTQVRKILERATVGINLPACKMHWGTGITVAMKNHFGSISNPARFHNWEENRGGAQFAPMYKTVGEIYGLAPIGKKEKLIICDALRPVWDGGPGDNPANRWNCNAIIMGTDGVAVDSICCNILEAKRRQVKGEPWPAASGRKSVEYAASLGLGNAARARIELVGIRLG